MLERIENGEQLVCLKIVPKFGRSQKKRQLKVVCKERNSAQADGRERRKMNRSKKCARRTQDAHKKCRESNSIFLGVVVSTQKLEPKLKY